MKCKSLMIIGIVFILSLSLSYAADASEADVQKLIDKRDLHFRLYNISHDNSSRNLNAGVTGNYFNRTHCLNQTYGCWATSTGADQAQWVLPGNHILAQTTENRNMTFSVWVNLTNSPAGQGGFIAPNGGARTQGMHLSFSSINDGRFSRANFVGNSNVHDVSGAACVVVKNQWSHLILVYNATDETISCWVDGVFKAVGGVSETMLAGSDGVSDFGVGAGQSAATFTAQCFTILVNVSANESERAYLNNTCLPDVIAAPPPAPSVAPIINGTLNSTIVKFGGGINASYNVTDETALSTGQVIINQSGFNQYFNFSLSGTRGNFSQNFTISCNSGCVINITGRVNDSTNVFSQNSTLITVAGTEPPSASLNGNNFFNANNQSVISYASSGSVLLNLSLTDDIDLYGIEFNVTNATWQLIINFTNISFSGASFTFAKLLNVTAPQGYYNVSFTVWDTHTSQDINFEVNDGFGGTIEFDNKIKISADNAIYSKAIKNFDRYNLEFEYLIAPKTKVFYVESDGILEYRQDSQYKGHFIDWKNKRWIDFEGVEGTPIITKVKNNKWKIQYDNPDSKITFKSIGGLNSRLYNYKYYLANPLISWVVPPSNAVTFSNASFSAVLNVTNDFHNYTTFWLWNSTLGLVQSSNVSYSGNGTFFYNNTFTNLVDNLYYFNATAYSQGASSKNSPTITLAKIQINNCTPPGINAINYTFKDEQNQSIIPATVTGDYDYNISSTYSVDYTSIMNFTVCVYPNGSSIPASYSLFYSGTGYPQRQYYDNAAVLNNQTVPITLWMLGTGTGIYARFKVVDTIGNALQNAKGIMSRTISGSSQNIEIETSDSSGLMTFFENPDVTYDFTFSLSGYQTLTTSLRITTGDIYTITLSSTATTTIPSSYGAYITYSLTPNSQVLQNKTAYEFNFNVSSLLYNMTNCALYIENSTQQLTQTIGSSNGSLCNIAINFNTGNQTSIFARGIYQLNGTINQSVLAHYTVKYGYVGTFSLKNAIDDISNFGGSGFGNFGRAMLAFIFTFMIVGGLSINYSSLKEPEAILLVAWGLTTLFSYVGWYTIPYTMPSISVGGIGLTSAAWLQKYMIWILMTLFTSGYLMDKLSQ